MGFFSRQLPKLFRSLGAASAARKSAPDFDQLSQDIDKMIDDKMIVRFDEMNAEIIEDPVEQKASGKSKLEVRDTGDRILGYVGAYGFLSTWARRYNKKRIPDRGNPDRDYYLADMWKDEPILAGAVYSMTAKMTSLRWSVTGKRLKAKKAAEMLAGAAHMGGNDWGGFISSTAEDFYTVNRGVFWETPRYGSSMTGRIADLGHIDALACTLTGASKYPMIYASETTGQIVKFRPGEFIHFSTLPSAREIDLGMGFCAVDRAYRAAKLLVGLHDYDSEKLSNLPPEGVATVTGMTIDEFNDALALWKEKRKTDESLTFPQVLWLLGSQPNVEVKVAFTGFSQIPESFNREEVVRHYVSTLALDFGVDAREFWPISSGSLGTAAESEIQHLKAKGKGPGEFISITERHINSELDDDTDFSYDTQDIEEDANAAAIAKAWVDAYFGLTSAGGAAEEVINTQTFLRLLADKNVIPDYIVRDDRVAVLDTDIHLSKEGHADDVTKYIWDKGILKETRPSPIIINSTRPVRVFDDVDLPIASVAKEEKKSNGFSRLEKLYLEIKQRESDIYEENRSIRGEPIPDRESIRGDRITENTIRDEIERWKKNSLLAQYVPTDEELQAILDEVAA